MRKPKFYDASKVGTLYLPKVDEVVTAGKAAKLKPASNDRGLKIILLLVDPQIDFIHINGALSVPGAVEDTRRTNEWIFNNIDGLSAVAASLDTHLLFQIFSSSWWVDKKGNPPAPFTAITLNDYQDGIWRPVSRIYNRDASGNKVAWDTDGKYFDWNEYYLARLEEQAKKPLVIWPFHTMLGTPGHAIDPSLFEAILYHGAARMVQPQFLTKGSIPKSENYSIMEPEVKVADHPLGGLNTDFLDMLAGYDLIYIAGQAKSHCVLETILSIVRYFDAKAPDALDKIRVLEDCMSSVSGFEDGAEKAFAELQADFNLRMVKSSDRLG
jgi:nicotinamidase/pyrazinamidase